MSEMMVFTAIVDENPSVIRFREFSFKTDGNFEVGSELTHHQGFTTYHFRITAVDKSARTVNVKLIYSTNPR
jgi:hypothetical protein